MKIINPSAEIIETELEQLSLYQRIDRCASVCYQRPPKPTEEEAQAFCKKMVSIGHHSTLEMAVVHLVGDIVDVPSSKYIAHTMLDTRGERCVITGSIRAFIEADGEYGSQVWNLLADQYPVLFTESDPPKGKVRFANPNEIPWQHKHVAVRFIVNRAVSHELVRHRHCSFLQESQRYCRYEDEVVFIRPEFVDAKFDNDETHFNFDLDNETFDNTLDWISAVDFAECRYKSILKRGRKPQQARAVLPNSTKTELIAYASLPQWLHMFNLRCSPAADPEMRRIMIPLREEFKAKYPDMWGDK